MSKPDIGRKKKRRRKVSEERRKETLKGKGREGKKRRREKELKLGQTNGKMKASNFRNPSVSSRKKYGKSQQLFPENM
jgi:hypothetical protein